MYTTAKLRYLHTLWFLLGALTLSGLLGGCALSPHLDAHWGESVRNVERRQALHTVIRTEHDDPEGLDGRAAEALINRYYKSFEDPPKASGSSAGSIGSGGGVR